MPLTINNRTVDSTNPPRQLADSRFSRHNNSMMQDDPGHIPILVDEIAAFLPNHDGAILIDCTAGRGGHIGMMLDRCPAARVIGLDVDADNLAYVEQRHAAHADRLTLHRSNFADLPSALETLDSTKVDFILADLGISSSQLDDAARGLSFDREGPLDMRLDDRLKLTAADIVNAWPEGKLADLFWHLAQEKHSRKIAKRIVHARRQMRINSTMALARVVASTVPGGGGHKKIHPATRVFMALRMEVNQELAALEALLATAPQHLRPGGRLAIISFHSGEDRLVKSAYKEAAREGKCRILTKKPLAPSEAECAANPRSRSAKLRVMEQELLADP